jgi:hypothetical protein
MLLLPKRAVWLMRFAVMTSVRHLLVMLSCIQLKKTI